MSGRPTPDRATASDDDERTELGEAPAGASGSRGARQRTRTEELPAPEPVHDDDDDETTAAATMPHPKGQVASPAGRRTLPVGPPRSPARGTHPAPRRGGRTEPLPGPVSGEGRAPAAASGPSSGPRPVDGPRRARDSRKKPGVAAPLGFTIPRDPHRGVHAARAHVSDRDWAGSALENAVQGSRDDDEHTAAEPVPFEAPPIWQAARQRPGIWVLAVLILLGLVGGTIWRVLESRRDEEARLEKARNDAQPPWLRKSNRPAPPPPPQPPG